MTFSALQASAKATLNAALAGTGIEVELRSGKEDGTLVEGKVKTDEAARFDAWLTRIGSPEEAHAPRDLDIRCEGKDPSDLTCALAPAEADTRIKLNELPEALMREFTKTRPVAPGDPSTP